MSADGAGGQPALSTTAALAALRRLQPVWWANPDRSDSSAPLTLADGTTTLSRVDVDEAAARFERFMPLLAMLFDEVDARTGLDSALLPLPAMQARAGLPADWGRLWAKCDHALPVAGSIKARGGIHEVLAFAEQIAARYGFWKPGDDVRVFATPAVRRQLAQVQVSVGSTGNLGLSIGTMAAALGFRARVHMSVEARAWKKARLRGFGVEVIEHTGDYSAAVASGRDAAHGDPDVHFVDDERSLALFRGYSAAALRLQRQLGAAGITVDAGHPLFVYLPCGVGGAPAGIAFGLRQVLPPEHVYCFFAEPVQSACFAIQMLAAAPGHHSVHDFGMQNRTIADGLAVPRASLLAVDAMRTIVAGGFTVTDDDLLRDLALLHDSEGLRIEPSAAAGFAGPRLLCGSAEGQAWLAGRGLLDRLPQATHVVWTTGGLYVPDTVFDADLAQGRARISVA